jgi:site-specific DNA-cytosine methylase
MNLESTCQHFVDRLCTADLDKLRAICAALSGKTIRVATTCSGLESPCPVIQQTLRALNKRFNCNIQASFIMAVEIDETRQDYIREAHGHDLGALFEDVRCIPTGKGQCILKSKTEPVVKLIHNADILISGPSCTNLSKQRRDASAYVGCYHETAESAQCESGITYRAGFRDAIPALGVKVAIFENVTTVFHRLQQPDTSEPMEPIVDTVSADMTARGCTFECAQYNSHDFLVRARRNRAWGCVDRGLRDKDTVHLHTHVHRVMCVRTYVHT